MNSWRTAIGDEHPHCQSKFVGRRCTTKTSPGEDHHKDSGQDAIMDAQGMIVEAVWSAIQKEGRECRYAAQKRPDFGGPHDVRAGTPTGGSNCERRVGPPTIAAKVAERDAGRSGCWPSHSNRVLVSSAPGRNEPGNSRITSS